jgi:hypothetical protein
VTSRLMIHKPQLTIVKIKHRRFFFLPPFIPDN